MKLYGTYPSHFTRKVRILLQELQIPYEFIVITALMDVGAEKFAGNPLHQFPVLEDGAKKLIESDIICEYLIENYGKNSAIKTFLPNEENKYADLKRLAIINGVMSSGVKLIRGKRSEIANLEQYPFFRQEKAAALAGLEWLNKDLGHCDSYYLGRLTMLDISLQCLCEWVVFREIIPNLALYPNLNYFVEQNKNRASFALTHPSKIN